MTYNMILSSSSLVSDCDGDCCSNGGNGGDGGNGNGDDGDGDGGGGNGDDGDGGNGVLGSGGDDGGIVRGCVVNFSGNMCVPG